MGLQPIIVTTEGVWWRPVAVSSHISRRWGWVQWNCTLIKISTFNEGKLGPWIRIMVSFSTRRRGSKSGSICGRGNIVLHLGTDPSHPDPLECYTHCHCIFICGRWHQTIIFFLKELCPISWSCSSNPALLICLCSSVRHEFSGMLLWLNSSLAPSSCALI